MKATFNTVCYINVLTQQSWNTYSLHSYRLLVSCPCICCVLIGCYLISFTLIGCYWDNTNVLALFIRWEGQILSWGHFCLPLHPFILPWLASFKKLNSSVKNASKFKYQYSGIYFMLSSVP